MCACVLHALTRIVCVCVCVFSQTRVVQGAAEILAETFKQPHAARRYRGVKENTKDCNGDFVLTETDLVETVTSWKEEHGAGTSTLREGALTDPERMVKALENSPYYVI